MFSDASFSTSKKKIMPSLNANVRYDILWGDVKVKQADRLAVKEAL